MFPIAACRPKQNRRAAAAPPGTTFDEEAIVNESGELLVTEEGDALVVGLAQFDLTFVYDAGYDYMAGPIDDGKVGDDGETTLLFSAKDSGLNDVTDRLLGVTSGWTILIRNASLDTLGGTVTASADEGDFISVHSADQNLSDVFTDTDELTFTFIPPA